MESGNQPKTDKKKLAANETYLQKLDRVTIRLYKDGRDGLTKEQLEQTADAAGESVNTYAVTAIKQRMDGTAVSAPTSPAEGAEAPRGETTPPAPQNPAADAPTPKETVADPAAVTMTAYALDKATTAAERTGETLTEFFERAAYYRERTDRKTAGMVDPVQAYRAELAQEAATNTKPAEDTTATTT